jgi:hypothetical protein
MGAFFRASVMSTVACCRTSRRTRTSLVPPTSVPPYLQLDSASRKNEESPKTAIMLPWLPSTPLSDTCTPHTSDLILRRPPISHLCFLGAHRRGIRSVDKQVICRSDLRKCGLHHQPPVAAITQGRLPDTRAASLRTQDYHLSSTSRKTVMPLHLVGYWSGQTPPEIGSDKAVTTT